MNKTRITITTLHRVNGETTPPESYCQLPYQHPASYTPSPEQSLEESIAWKKRMEALEDLERRIKILEDLKSCQNFQIKDPYPIFQEEHTDLEKSMEFMIQIQSDPLKMIETRLSRLENMHKNKKTLPTQSLTIASLLAILMKTKNHEILKTLTKIQFHYTNLNLTNSKL